MLQGKSIALHSYTGKEERSNIRDPSSCDKKLVKKIKPKEVERRKNKAESKSVI